MSYSDLYFQEKTRIPKKLVVLAVLVLVAFGASFFKLPTQVTKASPTAISEQELVNLSAHTAGVIWKSTQKTSGWVIFGENNNQLNSIAFDVRDTADLKGQYYWHYTLLNDLSENKLYFYKIINNNAVVSPNNAAFFFKTPIYSNNSTTLTPAYGKIIHNNGEPVQNALVIYNYPNAIPLVAMTHASGEWLLPLQYVYSKEGTVINVDTNKIVTIDMKTDDEGETHIETLVKNSTPLSQTTILGQNYRILNEVNVLPASTQRTSDTKTLTSPIDITYPKQNAVIAGTNPLIKGIALPGKEVFITIDSKPQYNLRIQADQKGQWMVHSTVSLLPRSYKLTLTTVDGNNEKVKLERSFTIAKSGEQVVLGTATPSASLTPSVSPTEVPTDVPTMTLTPVVSQPIVTEVPTNTPAVVTNTPVVITNTPAGKLLKTGNSDTLLVGGSAVLIAVGIAVMVLF